MWKHSREDPVTSLAGELTVECESLLTGRFADYLCSQGRYAPPWAWLNALAHCSEPELATLAAGGTGVRGNAGASQEFAGSDEWRQALAFLAEEILSHVQETDMTLAQLQEGTLIPLELDLCRRPEDLTLHPGQLAGLVLAAVHPA